MLLKFIKDVVVSSRSARPELDIPTLAMPRPVYREKARIVLFTAGSEGDALGQATKELADLIKPVCTDAVVININSPDWNRRLAEVVSEPVWFAMSFFGVGENVTGEGGDNLWHSNGIPFVRIYGDIPAYFPTRHLEGGVTSINLYAYKEHLDFYKALHPGFPAFSPPPLPLGLRQKRDIDFSKKRDGKIVFPKNGNSPEALLAYWRQALPSTVSEFLENTAEDLLLPERLGRALDVRHICGNWLEDFDSDLVSNRRLYCFVVSQLDDMVRRHKSTMIARAVLDFPVEIRGNSWEHVNFGNSRARWVRDSSYENTSNAMRNFLAVIDMSPNTESYPHDRILRSAAQYTCFLTNRQKWIDEQCEGKIPYAYEFNADSIKESLESVLQDPGAAVESGVTVSEMLRERYSEGLFIASLIKSVELCAFSVSQRPDGTQYYVEF